jgi:hypothetical protein
MSVEEANALALEIATELRACSMTGLSIRLDHDADVVDLTLCVDVRVVGARGEAERTFSIVTCEFLAQTLKTAVPGFSEGWADVRCYCSAGPLCVVDRITGRAVVASVVKTLCMERG